MTMKQKLSDLIDSLGQEEKSKEIWGDVHDAIPQSVTLHIDTLNNDVSIFSDDVDTKGRPVMQWEMNKETGHITETKRNADGSEVHVKEKDVDVKELT